MYYIYKRTNLIDNKVYIGQTINYPEIRWRAEDISSQEIGKAVRKVGSDNFKNEIIDFAEDRKELNEKEIKWIAYYDSNNPEKGYNRTKGGSGGGNSTYRKIIVWQSMEIIFPTQKSIANFIYENQMNNFTLCQIERFIRIGLRTKTLEVNFFGNKESSLLDLYELQDYKGDIPVANMTWLNCYNACNNFG